MMAVLIAPVRRSTLGLASFFDARRWRQDSVAFFGRSAPTLGGRPSGNSGLPHVMSCEGPSGPRGALVENEAIRGCAIYFIEAAGTLLQLSFTEVLLHFSTGTPTCRSSGAL